MKPANSQDDPKVKPYTLAELAVFYNVSAKTLRKWIVPHEKFIGEKRGWFYTTRQVRIIFERLGEP